MNINNPNFETQTQSLNSKQFEMIATIAHKEAGLVFPQSKKALVSSRLSKRLRVCGFEDFQRYCHFITSEEGKAELRLMISALTTNISSFFRENHHFEAFRKDVLPELIMRAQEGDRVRIWSAGCSVGMEAYSIAILILENLPKANEFDIKILASDIDPSVLETGRQATFDIRQLESIPIELRSQYFESEYSNQSSSLRATSELRKIVSFRELNLLEPWPIKGKFDVIFCRNTVIYFDEETQDKLWPRFQKTLKPDGWLFVGHSERISEISKTDFESCGMTIYRRRSENSN